MLGTLIVKELKAILASPKFAATFAVCSLLILLSIFIGIREYRTAVRQYDEALQLAAQNVRTQASWMGLTTTTYRMPDPMQISRPLVKFPFTAPLRYQRVRGREAEEQHVRRRPDLRTLPVDRFLVHRPGGPLALCDTFHI